MKISTVTSKGFRPFEFKVKVQSEDELEILWAIFNTPSNLQLEHKHTDSDFVVNKFREVAQDLFKAIDYKREEAHEKEE